MSSSASEREASLAKARGLLATGRELRAHAMRAHTALWQRLKSRVAEPRRTPNAEVLVRVGDLLDLLDATQVVADDYARALNDRVQALELTAQAVQSITAHKQARGNAIAQLNNLKAKYGHQED